MICILTRRRTFDLCWGVSAEGQRVWSHEQNRQLAEHQAEHGQDQAFVLGLVQEVGGAVAPNRKNETTSKAPVRFDQADSPEDAGGSSGESSAQLVFAAENRQNQNHQQLQGRVNILNSPVHTPLHVKARR